MKTHTYKNKLGNIKSKHIAVLCVFVFSVVVSPLVTNNAHAASLTSTFVRFDRIQTSTATTGTVCVNPTTVATEAHVKVTFPAGYTVNTTLGNWTVDTTNLAWPATAVAWPGIGTATAAASQDVTFPSTDLTVGTLYCFNWLNSAGVSTQSGASSANVGTVTTQDSGPATIDSASFTTQTLAGDQITVTATVPQAFSFALSNTSDALSTLSTGSVTTSPTPRTVTVNTNAKNGWQVWAKDAYQGLCSPSLGTCTVGSAVAAPQLATTATGSNRTLSAGTTDFNTGVTKTQTSGSGTVTVAAPFVGGSLGAGGGLSATALQSLVSSTGTANNAVVTLNNNVAINAIQSAAADYSDTITVTGAGLF